MSIPLDTPEGISVRLVRPIPDCKFFGISGVPVGTVGEVRAVIAEKSLAIFHLPSSGAEWYCHPDDLELVSEDPKGLSCLSCRFFRRAPRDWGYCHRHAPFSMDEHGQGEWPRTYDVDTCGDHEPGELPGAHSRRGI